MQSPWRSGEDALYLTQNIADDLTSFDMRLLEASQEVQLGVDTSAGCCWLCMALRTLMVYANYCIG